MISLWYDVWGRLTLQPKGVVEYVGHFQLFGLGVQSLGSYPHLNVVALCVSHLRVVVQQRTDLHPVECVE